MYKIMKYSLIIILFLHVFNINAQNYMTDTNLLSNYFDFPVKPKEQWTVYSDGNFGVYRSNYSGYHSGEDWNKIDGNDLGAPVYSIADGIVTHKSDLSNLGWCVVIQHDAPQGTQFKIPGKSTSNFSYPTETVNRIYSVYIHIKNIPSSVYVGSKIFKGSIVGYIMDPGYGPHLHFEIRHPNAQHSFGGSMLYPVSNWAPSGTETNNGHYLNMQTLVNSGARSPSEFLNNNISNVTPFILLNKSTLDFGNQQVNTYSNSLNYTISGSNLTGNITITPPSNFQISENNTTWQSTSIILNQSGGSVPTKTIYVRFNPTTSKSYSGNISHSSPGVTTQNIAVSGTGISLNPIITSISPNYFLASNNNQLMIIQGTNFQNGATLTFTLPNGTTINSTSSKLTFISSTQINYQFNNGNDIGTWKVKVNNPDGGTSNDYSFQVVTGSNPIINISKISLDFGNQLINTISNSQSYIVSGSNLINNITISSPSGFEISLDNINWQTSSIILNHSKGTVPSTTIYVRFAPTSVKNYSGIYITHVSGGADSKYVELKGNGVQQSQQIRAITISGKGPWSNYGFHYTIPIDINPPDKNGNSSGQTTSVRFYNEGTTVNLTAPKFIFTDQPFIKWLKNGTFYSSSQNISFIVNSDAEFTAVYGYSVILSCNPANSGTVSGEGNYEAGTTINISAVAKPGYTFVYWTGGGGIVSSNSNYSFIIQGNMNLVANFSFGSGIPVPPQLLSPANDQKDIPINQLLVFEWQPVFGATDYIFQISKSPTFSPLILEANQSYTRINYGVGDFEYGKTYYWRVKARNSIGSSEWSEIWKFSTVNIVSINDLKYDFDNKVFQNYPNPFNSTTIILYFISRTEFVTIKVFDMLGNELAILVNEEKQPGNYEVKFDGHNLPSGIYYYQIRAGQFVDTKKFVLLK